MDHAFPPFAAYESPRLRVWCAGAMDRAPSIAGFFGGDGLASGRNGRTRRSRVLGRAKDGAAQGGVSILFSPDGEPAFPDPDACGIVVPVRIGLSRDLPDTTAALMADIRTSTTQEDLRRIRKAGFTFRVTRDPAALRQFHVRQYSPLVTQRFPDDGWIMSPDEMDEGLRHGGELLCADLGGDWVAGLFNWDKGDHYAMGPLGIRDADDRLRNLRVVSGLLVASMERAVTLGRRAARLGYSLPFLGKGPIWFKAKWGCSLSVHPSSPVMQLYADLRHASLRQALADSPVLFRDGADLSVCAWLLPGEAQQATLVREAGRYADLSRWYVLGDPETLAAAVPALRGNDRIVPVPVGPAGEAPLWLGQLVGRA